MVSVNEINLVKEKRVAIIKMLVDKKGFSVISFKLNIPGENKKIGFSDEIFNEGIKSIKELCKDKIVWNKILNELTGDEFFASVDIDAVELKKFLTEIEDNHPLGRIFDIDVVSVEGKPVKRKDVGKRERICFICDRPALECARSRKHSVEEMIKWIESRAVSFFNR